jgi:hypothetical protein
MLIDAAVAQVSARIAALFVKLPMLTGFSVQQSATGELRIADVSVDAWPGWQAGPAVHDEIAQALLELINEHPESYDALRGHTFARTFH